METSPYRANLLYINLLTVQPGIIVLRFAIVLAIAFSTPWWASAQSADDSWAVPLNISHAGGATNPAIVIDSNAVVHVVWEDGSENYVYSQFNGGHWSAPQRTDLSLLFGQPNSPAETGRSQEPISSGQKPFFISGPGPYILAFWINPEGELYMSRVRNNDFMDVTGWQRRQLLSPSAASFAVALDALGGLHLSYFRTVDDSENSAGIYYMRSKDDGQNWGLPSLLYESSYFRGLSDGEANLSLATGGTADAPLVYIAWDNRPRKQVFLAKSADGGASWEQPLKVDGPTPDSGSAGPFNIRVGAKENSAVLVWQNGQPGSPCTQFFQSSVDAGVTWSEALLMMEGLAGCAQANEFVTVQATNPGGFLYLLTNIQGQIFLSAWNGTQMSKPQAQPVLSGFEDLEIYTQVVFDCHRAALFGEQLYIVGCDRGAGGDIWVTSRNIQSSTTWFLPQVWSRPAPITSDNLEMAAIEMVATEDELIHVFFSQQQDPAIHYTRWDGATWSLITSVLQLPDGDAGLPAIAAGPGDKLFLIARSSRGSLYFSRVNSGDAVVASRWSPPARLQIAHDGKVSSADVVWDAAGVVHIAYSVLMNEARGVYLIQSEDQGDTWSKPVQVFNGAAAGFDLVGSPSLLVSDDGSLHIIWKQQSIQVDGVSQPLSLHYARSEDAGHTFKEAELVVEAPVAWRDIVVDGQGNLHRLWQRLDMMRTVWDQVSIDGGRTWQVAQQLPAEWGGATVTVDPAGRLHLVGLGLGSLGHWIWEEKRWHEETPIHWSSISRNEGPVELLAATVNREGKMIVVSEMPAGTGQVAEKLLFYATRTLDLPPGQTVIPETPTRSPPSPTFTPVTPSTEGSLATATSIASQPNQTQGTEDGVNTGDTMNPFARALIPLAILHLSLLGIFVYRTARGKAK